SDSWRSVESRHHPGRFCWTTAAAVVIPHRSDYQDHYDRRRNRELHAPRRRRFQRNNSRRRFSLLTLTIKRRLELLPHRIGRAELRQLFRQLDPQLDLFKLCSTLHARKNMFGKLPRLLTRKLSMTIG